MKAGDVTTPDAVRSTRPGYGVLPKCIDRGIGKRLRSDVQFATPVRWYPLE